MTKKKRQRLTAAVLSLLLLVLSCVPASAASDTAETSTTTAASTTTTASTTATGSTTTTASTTTTGSTTASTTTSTSKTATTKKDMTKYIRYAQKGYMVIAWNNSKTKNVVVYKKASRSSGKYGRLGYGGAIVVNMDKVQSMTAKKTVKTLNWIPVYMKTSGTAKAKTAYLNSSAISFTVLNTQKLSSNSIIQKALTYGLSYLGTPYLLGGSSISSAIDCSNFVNKIYQYAGKTMPSLAHTAYLQQVSYAISKKDLKPGDLVFYLMDDTSGPIDHVGVYLGKGLMIHASGRYGHYYPQGGICIKRISYGKREPVRYMRLKGF